MKIHIKRIMILAFTFIFTFVSLTVPKIEVKAAGNIEFFTKDAFSKMWDESTEKFEKIFYDDYHMDTVDSAYDYAKECWRVIQNTGSFVGSLGKMGGCALSDVNAFYQYLVSGHPDGAIDLIKTFNDTKIDGVTIKDGGGGIRKPDNTLSNINVTKNQTVEVPKEQIQTFRTSVMKYIEEYDGYYMYPTITPKEYCIAQFDSSTAYNNALSNINNALQLYDSVLCGSPSGNLKEMNYMTVPYKGDTARKEYVKSGRDLKFYSNDWKCDRYARIVSKIDYYTYSVEDLKQEPDSSGALYKEVSDSNTISFARDTQVNTYGFWIGNNDSASNIRTPEELIYFNFVTKDGHYVKIWKNEQAPKNAELQLPRAYVTNLYNQNTVVNTVNGDTFNGCNIVTDYNNIQTQINGDNVQNADTIINNYYNSPGSGGSGSGSGNGSDGNDNNPSGWDVIQSLTEGLGSLLGVIATLIGNVMKIVGDLLQTFLDTLDNLLSLLTGGFADFLTAAFPFIPEEIWTTIILGIEVMVIVAIIKAVRS